MRRSLSLWKTLLIALSLSALGCAKSVPEFPTVHPKMQLPSKNKVFGCSMTDTENLLFSCSKFNVTPFIPEEQDERITFTVGEVQAILDWSVEVKKLAKEKKCRL